MASVFIPPPLRSLTGGQATVTAKGTTVREVLEALDAEYPGIKSRLCAGDELRPDLTIVVNSDVEPAGLRATVTENCEVHFLPALGGG